MVFVTKYTKLLFVSTILVVLPVIGLVLLEIQDKKTIVDPEFDQDEVATIEDHADRQTTELEPPDDSVATTAPSDEDEDDTVSELPPTDDNERVYIRVQDSCDHNFSGKECVKVHSNPSTEATVIRKLRNGMVLEVEAVVEGDENYWYKIVFDQELLYPERVEHDWYVATDVVEAFTTRKPTTSWEDNAVADTNKRIVVDRSANTLHAYEGEKLFLEAPISTGVGLTPTPTGTFSIFKKMPSRYMQGPIPTLPADDEYDLAGVPWNLYFTVGGAVIHGTYWHDNFGAAYSHGCVNLEPAIAERLYDWAVLGTQVIVKN